MKIDVFNHVFPIEFFEQVDGLMPDAAVKRWKSINTIYDMDARLRMLDEFDDYQQIISMSQPPTDAIAGPNDSPALTRVANDGMARICREHPDRMPWFIASLPMNNTTAAVAEVDRVIDEHNAVGFQLFTNVNNKALDQPEFRDIFAKIAERGKIIWLHPTRPATHPDYLTEDRSFYEIFWGFGWAYETSVAMARIVCSGMFDEIPDLKIIAHHWGAYALMRRAGSRPHGKAAMRSWATSRFRGQAQKPLVDYFKKDFYGDTAMFGAQAASQAGFDFFGADHSVFATDAPYDHEGGAYNIRSTLEVLKNLRCTDDDRQMIFEDNARRLFGI